MCTTIEGRGWVVTEGTRTAVTSASEETAGREETGTEVKVEAGVYSIVA